MSCDELIKNLYIWLKDVKSFSGCRWLQLQNNRPRLTEDDCNGGSTDEKKFKTWLKFYLSKFFQVLSYYLSKLGSIS